MAACGRTRAAAYEAVVRFRRCRPCDTRSLRRDGRSRASWACKRRFCCSDAWGVDVPSLSQREITAAYFELAKRHHDIGNRNTGQLMANINAARTIIQRGYRKD